MVIWLTYCSAGIIAGILAGLLGVGGGIIIVPMLTLTFTLQHFAEPVVHHLALGTSLGTIIFTSFASFRAHHRHGAVNWQVVRHITPGILVGTLAGSSLAAHLSTTVLRAFFIAFTYYVALQMLTDIKPRPGRQLPGLVGLSSVGTAIGAVSSLVGIGGGSMSVPFLVWCNLSMHNAIGTSAAIGFPIALFGTIGFFANGLTAPDLPGGSLGFIYLPALIGISLTSFIVAPLGARLAHRLPVALLKKIFACLLLVIGTRMLYKLLQ
jgi:uncharacterized membrane protein YfcA